MSWFAVPWTLPLGASRRFGYLLAVIVMDNAERRSGETDPGDRAPDVVLRYRNDLPGNDSHVIADPDPCSGIGAAERLTRAGAGAAPPLDLVVPGGHPDLVESRITSMTWSSGVPSVVTRPRDSSGALLFSPSPGLAVGAPVCSSEFDPNRGKR